ncbi:ABC transporter permease [Pseudactinotalea terrae]|uniref:ABC transporter permease n=1 Tax=Pseudactinotalea terrae TaxID=1743262 RepID=UPI0019D54E6F|nr:ABC transporter permease [Pseudactinotalea terrae]
MSTPTLHDATPNAEAAGLATQENALGEFWYRFSRNRAAVVCLFVVIVVIAAALLAPLISPYDPMSGVGAAQQPPGSPGHLLGTDHLGRDMFSQVIHGARVSLMVGFVVAAFATVLGVLIGALAGYYGGWVDNVLMRVTEFFQTLPRLVLALIIVALFGSGLTKLILVVAILSWPQTARVVRTGFRTLRSAAFVDAARVSGVPSWRIIATEILPNVLAPVVVVASLDVASAILTEASLSFFGLGDPNVVSWGGMLQQAQQYLRSAWWMAVFPGIAIAVLVLTFNVLGDGLNDALNPRLKDKD